MSGQGAAAWIGAVRPATLGAAVAPVLIGSTLAVRDGVFFYPAAGAALVAALLLQVGVNLVNDADDFERGADTERRLGPVRATQAGLLSAAQVRRAGWAAFAVAALVGCYLVQRGGWPILLLGVAALVSARAYTGGPWPLGYHGLGDVFVFVFFGLAAVAGTYYVQAGTVTATVWAATLPPGALATAILVVNNVRDRETDRVAGKRTLVVRRGDVFGRVQYGLLLVLAFVVPALMWAAHAAGAAVFLSWLALPVAVRCMRDMRRMRAAPEMNDLLRRTALLHLLFGVLFAGGLLL